MLDRLGSEEIIQKKSIILTLPNRWDDVAIGKTPIGNNSELHKVGKDNQIIIGDFVRLEKSLLRIRGNNNIIILGDGVKIRGLKLFINGDNNVVMIGAGVTWEEGAILCSPGGSTVLIGDDCMVSSGIMIRTSDGHGIFDRRTKEMINKAQDVTIHRHVWLGNGSRVSKGAKIGEGTVLAQLALAVGELEPHSVYGGIPAKRIRGDVVWSRTYEWPEEMLLDMAIS